MSDLLNSPTLVLNRNWQPVNVTSVQRAIQMMFRGQARAVEPNSYRLHDWQEWLVQEISLSSDCLRGAQQPIPIPEIVVLGEYDRRPKVEVAYSKRNVFRRDRYECQYCGMEPARHELTIDHVIPRSRGGKTEFSNCVSSCQACNRRKADRDPRQAGMPLRKLPRRPSWDTHFHRVDPHFESWKPFLKS